MRAVESPPDTLRETTTGLGADSAGRGVPPRLSSGPPVARSKRPSIRTVFLLALLFPLAPVVPLLLHHSGAPPQTHLASNPLGTIVSTTGAHGATLTVQTRAHTMVRVPLGTGHLVTQDNQSLSAASVRVGDSIETQSGTLVDTSQFQARTQGIVALGPDPQGDVMTVQITPTRTILVGIGPQTRINGAMRSVLSRMSIQVGQRVRLVGILDTELDEMTQTKSIDLVNPVAVG